MKLVKHGQGNLCVGVAPCAGAWIETVPFGLMVIQSKSPPARGRGLKRANLKRAEEDVGVAPCAGAWIETH